MSTQVPDIPQPGLCHSQRGSGDTSSLTLKSSQGARKAPLVPVSWSFRSGLQRARGSSTLPGTVLEQHAEARMLELGMHKAWLWSAAGTGPQGNCLCHYHPAGSANSLWSPRRPRQASSKQRGAGRI